MSKKNISMTLIMFSFGALIFYISLRNIPTQKLLHDLETMRLDWLLYAVLAMLVYLLIEAIIVEIFLPKHQRINFWSALRVPFMEQLGNGITPFATGGQPMQVLALMQAKVPFSVASSVSLMKFLVYQSMIVVNFGLAILIGGDYIVHQVHQFSFLVIFGFIIHFVVLALLLMIMLWPTFTIQLSYGCIWPLKFFVTKSKYNTLKKMIESKMLEFNAEAKKMGQNFKTISVSCVLTMIQLIIYYAIPYFLMIAMGYDNADFILVISLNMMIVLMISIFPIPGGAGGSEISFSSIFATFITRPDQLILAMLLWRLITYYLGMLLGLLAVAVPAKGGQKIDVPKDIKRQG